jgi:hypothetical protein
MSTVVDLKPTLDSHKPVGVNDPYGRGQLVVIDLKPAPESHKPTGVNDLYGRDRLGGQLRIRNGAFLVKKCRIHTKHNHDLISHTLRRSLTHKPGLDQGKPHDRAEGGRPAQLR